jgi:hypothetical protein
LRRLRAPHLHQRILIAGADCCDDLISAGREVRGNLCLYDRGETGEKDSENAEGHRTRPENWSGIL